VTDLFIFVLFYFRDLGWFAIFLGLQENAPAIIFIDEVDAIATARFDSQRGADREVERILMEILSQVCAKKNFV